MPQKLGKMKIIEKNNTAPITAINPPNPKENLVVLFKISQKFLEYTSPDFNTACFNSFFSNKIIGITKKGFHLITLSG